VDQEAARRRDEGRIGFFLEIAESLRQLIEWRCRYTLKDDKGESRAERNERFNRASLTPEEPWIPDEAVYLLEWFEELSATRATGMSGPNPLAPSDVYAWSTITGARLTPNEYFIIRVMDAAYVDGVLEFLKEQREVAASQSSNPPPTVRSYR
jgi:hypothetical protein